MGGKTATGVVSLALVTGCGGAAKPHFRSATGWHVLAGIDELAAANVDFAAQDRSMTSPPSRTVATLPRDGIVIWAMVSREKHSPESTPLPLRLSEAQPSNPFEGFRCAPAVSTARCYAASGSVRRLVGQVDRNYVDLYVFFGTDHPTAESLTAANAELARLQLPAERLAAPTAPAFPTRTGAGAYDTTLSPSAGPPGSTVTLSGHLPVIEEDGSYAGQTAARVDAYWNLDFKKWWTALTSAPLPSVPNSPVRHLGSQDVSHLCTYRVRVTIPSVAPGRYPVDVLFGTGKSRAGFAPESFRVRAG